MIEWLIETIVQWSVCYTLLYVVRGWGQ